MKVTVIVGVIGSGKTTMAREMARREPWPAHISFDHVWHGCIQLIGDTPRDAVDVFARAIRVATASDVVIDGWWTWTPRWYETKDDTTLDVLADLVAPRPIQVVHLVIPDDVAVARYENAARDDGPRDAMAYLASLPARNAYLSRKVKEWEQSSATSSLAT